MTTAPPVPPDTGPADFVAALRRLKAWSGLSYRLLERRAADAGHVLPYSTAATMLRRDRLPRAELVVAFVAACGLRGEEAEAWPDARSRIACAAAPDPAGPGPAALGPAGPGGGVVRPAASSCGCADPGGTTGRGRAGAASVPRRGRRWAVAGAVGLLVVLAGGVAAAGGLGSEEVQKTRTASVAAVPGE